MPRDTPKRNPLRDIDEERLDQEWVEQPGLCLQHALEEVEARRDYTNAKAAMELIDAEISRACRLSPEEYGMDKVTDETVKACVRAHAKYQDAQRTMIDAKYVLDLHGAHMIVLKDKKDALENLVKLHLTNFHSEPTVNGKAGRDYADQARERAAFSKEPKRTRRS